MFSVYCHWSSLNNEIVYLVKVKMAVRMQHRSVRIANTAVAVAMGTFSPFTEDYYLKKIEYLFETLDNVDIFL